LENLRDKVVCFKNGTVFKFTYDQCCVGYELTSDKIMSFLSNPVVLETGFTLRDYFKLILKHQNLVVLDNHFSEFIREYQYCPNNCVSDDYIFIQKSISHAFDDDEIFENIKVSGYVEKTDTNYALDFMNLEEIIDHKLVIRNCKIYDELKDKPCITFFELIKHIIEELSFYGSPFNRNLTKKNVFG